MVLDVFITLLGCCEPVLLNWINGRRCGLVNICAAIFISLAFILLSGTGTLQEPYAAVLKTINEYRGYFRSGFSLLRNILKFFPNVADFLSNALLTCMAILPTKVVQAFTKLIDFANKYIYNIWV